MLILEIQFFSKTKFRNSFLDQFFSLQSAWNFKLENRVLSSNSWHSRKLVFHSKTSDFGHFFSNLRLVINFRNV